MSLQNSRRNICVFINDSIGYINPEKYSPEIKSEIENMFQKAKTIIVDLRYGASPGFYLFVIKHIYTNSQLAMHIVEPDAEIPGIYRMNSVNSGFLNNLKHRFIYWKYHGKIIVLVNENTQSILEDITMTLQSYPNSIVIGSTTAGAVAEVVLLDLPGGIRTLFTGREVYYPDWTCAQRKGIKINENVEPTINGIKNGRDEVLEIAIEKATKHQ